MVPPNSPLSFTQGNPCWGCISVDSIAGVPFSSAPSFFLLLSLSFPSLVWLLCASSHGCPFPRFRYPSWLQHAFLFLTGIFYLVFCLPSSVTVVSFLTLPALGKLHCPEPRPLCCCCLLWLLPSHTASWLHKLVPHFTLIPSSRLVSFSTPGVGVEPWLYWKEKAEAQSHLCCGGQLTTFPGFPCSFPIDTSSP